MVENFGAGDKKAGGLFGGVAGRFGKKKKKEEKRSKLRSVFEAMDEDNSGSIDLDELKAVMEQISTDKTFTAPTEEELVAAFNAADVDGGGDIDFVRYDCLHPSFLPDSKPLLLKLL